MSGMAYSDSEAQKQEEEGKVTQTQEQHPQQVQSKEQPPQQVQSNEQPPREEQSKEQPPQAEQQQESEEKQKEVLQQPEENVLRVETKQGPVEKKKARKRPYIDRPVVELLTKRTRKVPVRLINEMRRRPLAIEVEVSREKHALMFDEEKSYAILAKLDSKGGNDGFQDDAKSNSNDNVGTTNEFAFTMGTVVFNQ